MQGDLREIQAEFWDWVNSDFVSLENNKVYKYLSQAGRAGFFSVCFFTEDIGAHGRHTWSGQKAQPSIPASICCCMCVIGLRLTDWPVCQDPSIRGRGRAHPCPASSLASYLCRRANSSWSNRIYQLLYATLTTWPDLWALTPHL